MFFVVRWWQRSIADVSFVEGEQNGCGNYRPENLALVAGLERDWTVKSHAHAR